MNDSERFQAWLQHAFESHQRDSETVVMGPFRAVVSLAEGGPATAWVTLVDTGISEREATSSLKNLRSAFARDKVDVELEYDALAFPDAGRWFQDAGLVQVEKNPLMACRPETFKPSLSADIALTRLTEHAKPGELEAFQKLRWTGGGDVDREIPPVERLTRDIRSPSSTYLLAWIDWEPVGTGVSHVTREAAEIVGVVTRKDRRRRGVAATVTSDLVRRHFERGGDFVFLDAADESAARVYERLGFTRFGSKVVYRQVIVE